MLFLLLTILSIPVYVIDFFGGKNINYQDSKDLFSLFTLGNLG